MKDKMKDKSKGFWAEFKKFISKGNVVDMAVGVAVATAFTAIVTAFTKGFIAPILSLLSHDASLSDMKWVIRPEVAEIAADGTKTVTTPEVAILWGAFLQAIIDFLIIAFVMFIFLKIVMSVTKKAEKMRLELTGEDKEREKAAAEAKAKEEAEKKAAEEAKAAAEAELAAEKARKARELELLEQIAASLKESR